MPKVAFYTLGCKVNQYESQKMAEAFVQEGFKVADFSDKADVYIVNSCTVTSIADSKSRQAVRGALRRNPDAIVVLTGCYAEAYPEEARRVEGVTLLLGNKEKSRIVEHIRQRLLSDTEERHRAVATPERRTRALLKIQDGCDQFCAYCAVPLARPVMSSRPASEVLDEARVLVDRGHKEIVLTGIRLGRYRDGEIDLVGLLRAMLTVHGLERIRLSSIEMTDVPRGLIDLMASEEKLCPHLHLPLQSGSDDVLRRMNRPYDSGRFERFVCKVRERIPEIAITTDLMVGFPGETEEDFKATCDLVERIRFARAHIFRFSPRPGTKAAEMEDDVPALEKKRRSDILLELTARHKEEYERRFMGRTVAVLLEGNGNGTKLRTGMTNNYMRIKFPSEPTAPGEIVNVRIERVDRTGVYGARC